MQKIFSFLPLGILSISTVAVAHERPNVVMILTDDLGIGDVGCYGQRLIPTPNIDSLSAHGIQFMQHYSGSTVSAPSRSCLMTGMHTGHTALRGNFIGERIGNTIYDRPLPDGEVTVGELFKQGGYSTGCVGKWGLGNLTGEGSPLTQGFDYFYGYETHIDAHRAYPLHLWENLKKVELGGTQYADELIVCKALNFIENNSERPFFLYLATTLPHADILVPEDEMQRFDDGRFPETPYTGGYAAQPKPRATFAAMITRIDNTVGRVVAQLKRLGIYENTIVIFTSDNGTHKEGGHDPYYFLSNSGYRGTKRDLYQGGIITPMIISWPDVVRAGSVSYHRSAFWDFVPTVCDIMGVAKPDNIDGISYLPTLSGHGEQPLHEYLYWEFHEEGGKQALLKGEWKLIRLGIKSGKPRYELYNISNDPKELRNVAEQSNGKVSELEALMNHARTPSDIWYFQQ